VRVLRPAFRCVVLAGLMLVTGAASAGAATFCVQLPGCPAGGTAEPSIQAAIAAAAAAAGPDRILLGPVTFAEGGLNAAPGNVVELVGAGAGQTVIAPPAGNGVTTLVLADAGSTVSDLTVRLAAGTSELGIALGGTARRVAVTAADGTTGGGVSLAVGGGGSFLDGTVSLPTTGALTGISSTNLGTVANSSIAAGTGILNAATVQHVRVDAGVNGILVNPISAAVTMALDDALVRIVGTGSGSAVFAAGSGFGSYAATLTARHVTAIGNGNAGSVGLRADAFSASPGTQTTSLTVSQTVLQGFGVDLARSANGFNSGASAIAQLTVGFSDLDPFKRTDSNTAIGGGIASGSIVDSGGDFTADPGFANAAAGDYSLAAGSPLIDRGDPAAPAIGEPATDLAGQPRVVDGDGNGSAIADVGAFEFVPPAPPAGGITSPPPPPAAAPTIDALALRPARFAVGRGATARSAAGRRARRVAHGTTIRVTLSRAASVAFAVQRRAAGRRSGRACVKPSRRLRSARRCTRLVGVFAFTRSGRAGANAFAFSGRAGRRALPAGGYVLRAVATADGLASQPRAARFAIVRG